MKKYRRTNDRVRHPGDKVVEFTHYLNMGGLYKISLHQDSSACCLDCVRNSGKPSWLQFRW